MTNETSQERRLENDEKKPRASNPNVFPVELSCLPRQAKRRPLASLPVNRAPARVRVSDGGAKVSHVTQTQAHDTKQRKRGAAGCSR